MGGISRVLRRKRDLRKTIRREDSRGLHVLFLSSGLCHYFAFYDWHSH